MCSAWQSSLAVCCMGGCMEHTAPMPYQRQHGAWGSFMPPWDVWNMSKSRVARAVSIERMSDVSMGGPPTCFLFGR